MARIRFPGATTAVLLSWLAACAPDEVPDEVPNELPSVPVGLQITTATTDSLALTWMPSTDDVAVVEYRVYRDGELLTNVPTLAMTDGSLRAGTHYCYAVAAVDDMGEVSARSGEVCASTSWNLEVVDSTGYANGQGNWGYTALAVDAANQVHLAYAGLGPTYTSARYSVRSQGAWSGLVFGGGANDYAWTTVDAASNNDATLCYATGGWMVPTVLLCREATPLVGHEPVTVDAGAFTSASFAFDSRDVGHISYHDVANADLKYATNGTGGWVTTVVDGDGDVGTYAALAIDADDHVHIAYHAATGGDLRYATDASGAWIVTTVDAEGYVGEYADLALDSSGHAHISYYDATHSDLRYATNAAGDWAVSVVDGEGEVGLWTSLALDSNDTPHIAYYDATEHDLAHATTIDGAWVRTTVHDGGELEVGRYSSMVIDSTDVVSISYDAGPNVTVANNR